MGQDGQYNSQSSGSSQYTDDEMQYLSDIQNISSVTGPLGIDPLNFTECMFFGLLFWLMYLFIPKGIRFTYFGAYPKRYPWSARTKRRRQKASSSCHNVHGRNNGNGGSGRSITETDSLISSAETASTMNPNHKELSAQGIGTDGSGSVYSITTPSHLEQQSGSSHFDKPIIVPEDEIIDFTTPSGQHHTMHQYVPNYSTNTASTNPSNNPPGQSYTPMSSGASTFNDEIAISTTMQQLRDTGVQIVAHGSKGKPKTVRLILTENAITWRTESTKRKNKVGPSHQIPLSHIMYVDVGKQTTALRRVENASLADAVCFSLLTKDGSLDLETASPLERDALVNCFSLVLDEVHAQNWRDLYRAPSSDLPSSFDEFDMGGNGGVQRMEV